MGEKRHFPVAMSKSELVAVLDHARQAVATGDSFEGWVRWEIPTMGPGIPAPPLGHDFDVSGVLRVGNSLGQGGVTIIGELREG